MEGDEADDDELRRADGECAEGQREQSDGHGMKLRLDCMARSVYRRLMRKNRVSGQT